MIRLLELKDISVLHERAENLQGKKAYDGKFEVVISQAAFKLPELLILGAPLLAENGILLAMKSANIGGELEAAKPDAAGLRLAASHNINLPLTGDERRILIYKKT